MTTDEVKDAIEKAGNEYAAKHMRQPTFITLRRDVDAALHGSAFAFLYDFIDMTMSRERFMGMDVTISEELEGPEFSIAESVEVME